VGLQDGEVQNNKATDSLDASALVGEYGARKTDDADHGTEDGSLGEWGQGLWQAQMSNDSVAAMHTVAKVPLAAVFGQYLYLNIKPQYTMFRKSSKRHTNYGTQVVRISESNGSASWGSKIDFELTRNGDLIAEAYLVVQLPCITGGWRIPRR
jgi:hypothetical protein